MNLFFLSKNPKKAAEYHCNKHVVKMILELLQMLYTAHYINNKNDDWKKFFEEKGLTPYKKCYQNHPITLWIAEDVNNYYYTLKMLIYLLREKKKRYPDNEASKCKPHALALLEEYKHNLYKPENSKKIDSEKYTFGFTTDKTTPMPIIVPDECKIKNENGEYDTVLSYREYYISKKRDFAEWYIMKKKKKTLLEQPSWFC